jgi:diguanylate cyclase (GGDEF)-like protein
MKGHADDAPAPGHRDALTGLLDGVGLRLHIDAQLERAAAARQHVALLFVDFDGFKGVDDGAGKEAGEEVIRKAAARLQSATRASDAVARLGGDEFAVVLGEIETEAQVRAAEARVRMAFIEPFTVAGAQISVDASVGGGMWPDDGRAADELVRRVDAAMYADRAEGGAGSGEPGAG